MFVVIAVGTVCLAMGLLTGTVFLLWLALGLGVIASAVFGLLMWRGRRAGAGTPELSEAAVEPARAPGSEARADDPGFAPDAEVRDADLLDADLPDVEVPDADLPDAGGGSPAEGEAPRTVRVIPGRRRFHLEECRLIAGKPAEEIALDEALEEGFTACSACIPHRDETLGAR